METRVLSEGYGAIGRELIASEPSLASIAENGVRIAFLESDSAKRRGPLCVAGECEKVPPKWRWCVPYDFAVTVYAPNVERYTDGQIRTLLLHELMHVGVSVDGNETKLFIVPHDVEDFREIIDEHGIDWAEPL